MEGVASLAAGALGLDPLTAVLSAVWTLCQEMQDAQQACTRVYERLADILDELRHMERLPAQEKIEKYAQLLHKYLAFLKNYRGKPLVWRLLKYSSMMDEIKTLHEEIDTLVVLLQLSTTRLLAEWKQQWERDGELQVQLLLAVVDNSASVLNEVRDARTQIEALTTLKYEFDHHQTERTDEMMRLMKTLYKQLVRVSRVEVPSIPQWFIPSSDVDYDISPFAQGSFGSVHHGRWNSGARVVVKTLLVDDLATASSGPRSAKERILAEIDVWFKLHHPNVIKMFGACHVSSPPFIVCELAPHGNVADFLVKSPEHHERMWRLLYEAALGLEYLHKRCVVHGDLKLNNILVGSDGSARLADFGLSAVRSTSATSTATATRPTGAMQTAGALRWRAPECLKGKPKFASDVYSLGMCIIEAATGEPPYATVADDIVFQLLRHGEIPDQPDELDDDAWALVTAMTKAQPAERCKLEFVISTLKRFAGDSVDADKGSLFTFGSSSSIATTASLSSASSGASLSRFASAQGVDDPPLSSSSTLSHVSSKNSARLDAGGPSLPSMASLSLENRMSEPSYASLESQPPSRSTASVESRVVYHPSASVERRGSNQLYVSVDSRTSSRELFDDSDLKLDETTSVPKLMEAVRSHAPMRRNKALQVVYHLTFDSNRLSEVLAHDPFKMLPAIAAGASIGFFQQLYSVGSLQMLSRYGKSAPAVPAIQLRDATATECAQLLQSLLPTHPDHEQLEAIDLVTILLHAKPNNTSTLELSAAAIIDLLRSSNALVSTSAAHATIALAANAGAATALVRYNAIPPLVDLVRRGDHRQQEAAVRAIAELTKNQQSAHQVAVAEAGGVAPLVTLIHSSKGPLRAASVDALSKLVNKCSAVKAEVMQLGAVDLLCPLLQKNSGLERGNAAMILGHLAEKNAANQDVIAQSGALAPLVQLVSSSNSVLERSAGAFAMFLLAHENPTSASTFASLGAVDALVDCLQSAPPRSERFNALNALWAVTQPPAYRRRAAQLAANVLRSIADSSSNDIEQRMAVKILEYLTQDTDQSSAKTTPHAAEAVTPIDARTPIPDLLRVVRAIAGRGGDQLTASLRWLYHHAYNFHLHALLQQSDAVTVLLDVALRDGTSYDHRLYAFGCLSQLSLEPPTRALVLEHLREPTYSDLQRLCVAMAPTASDDARAEATELVGCLQAARANDYGTSDILPRIVDGLRSATSPRLVGAAARTIAVFVTQLPACGNMLVELNVLPLLVQRVANGDAYSKEAATDALGAIAKSSPTMQHQVMYAGAVPPLVGLVHRGEGQQKILAVVALTKIMRENEVAQIMVSNAGVIGPLLDLLRSRDEADASYGALGLQSLCEKGETGAFAVLSLGGIPPLLDLLRWATSERTQLRAARALHMLSCKFSVRAELLRVGVRDAMLELARSTSNPEIRDTAHRTVANL